MTTLNSTLQDSEKEKIVFAIQIVRAENTRLNKNLDRFISSTCQQEDNIKRLWNLSTTG